MDETAGFLTTPPDKTLEAAVHCAFILQFYHNLAQDVHLCWCFTFCLLLDMFRTACQLLY
jgi:hypothetical protein